MRIRSLDFEDGGRIPDVFTCDGEDTNFKLVFEEIPKYAGSLALVMDDPDSPRGDFTHWVLYNISPGILYVNSSTAPGVEGLNDFGRIGYGGPCPSEGTHRYRITLYALDGMLDLPRGASRNDLEKAAAGKVLETSVLTGTYGRHEKSYAGRPREFY